jgi:hypothetical protein
MALRSRDGILPSQNRHDRRRSRTFENDSSVDAVAGHMLFSYQPYAIKLNGT